MIFIIELPDELAEEFSPSLTNPSRKALKSVDMYDFLDYMIGRGQQKQATSELKDALIGLKKLESSLPNNTPPNTPNKPSANNTPQSTPKPNTEQNTTMPSPEQNATKANAENPTATKANDSTPPKQSDQANTDNAGQVANNADSSAKTTQSQTIKKGTIAEQNEMLLHKDFVQQYENGDIVFLDKKGKKHILENQVQEEWLDTFGLESITQDFIPNIPSELRNTLGKDIKLKMGSLYKLVSQGREEFIPQIKQVLESPELALKDSDNTILLAKNLKDGDYFVNVSVDKDEAFISISNGVKEANNLKNKLEAGAQVIYQSPNANSNLQTLLQGSRYSPNKIDDGIIQNPAQNNPQTKLETTYFQRENLKREIDELEKEYFYQRRAADGSILPPKIDALSQSKRQKLDYERNELAEKAKALTNEIMQNHKILKTLNELNADEQISEAVLRNLINPNQTETPIKVIYKDFIKSGDEAVFINKQSALEYHDRAKNETKNNTLLRVARKKLEKAFNIEPIQEFGTNYAEFYQDGKGAISKLIAEANAAKQAGQDFSGQVAGAFNKEIDGAPARIDLVWGNEKMGLEKIVQKHLDDFSDFTGGNPQKKLANGLSEIITRGEVSKTHNGYNIKFNDFIVGINKGWNENGIKTGDNKWIVTAFDNSKEISKKATAANFTEGAAQPNNPADEIITKIQEKMKVSKEYAKNLAKWHKDSHPLTKEADGTPKVFYHGNKDNDISFEIFEPKTRLVDMSTPASFFSADKNTAKTYIVSDSDYPPQVFEVFLNVKNPLIIDFKGKPYREKGDIVDEILKGEKYFDEAVDKVLKKGKYDGVIYKNVRDNLNGQGETISDTIAVFDSNQIKEVGNKGTFDATNPNIYHSSNTAGAAVLGGTIAGVEKDDEGNIVGFSPERFALGFAAGAGGAKVLGKITNTQTAQNLSTKTLQMLAKHARTNPRAKAVLEKMQVKSSAKNDMPNQSLDTISREKNAIKDSNQMEIKQNTNGDYLLKDNEGKSHIVRKDLAQQWLDTFGLKSLSDDFTPNFTPQIKEILSKNGVDKIRLKIGSLLKLEANHRIKYLDRIKPTLETPEAVLRQNDGALIFVKDFKEKKFFTSVARDKNGEWIITSNAPKSANNIKNKIKQGGEFLYNEKFGNH